MTTSANDMDRRLRRALDVARSGSLSGGIGALRELLADAPDHLDAWGNLGYLLQLSGDYEAAAHCYDKVVENHPEDWEARRRLGDCWWAVGDRRRAYVSYKPLKDSPLAETAWIRQRIQATQPLGAQLLTEGLSLNLLFVRRLLDRGFLARYAREILGMRRSLPAIQVSGFSAYVNYLVEHYLRERFDRYPIAPCDLCGGTRLSPTFFFLGQKSVRCDDCGLEFVERKPPDSMDVMADWYNQDSSIEYMEKEWHSDRVFNDRVERLRRVFEESGRPFPRPGSRAFEIGCAEGHLLKYLADEGAEVQGIETGAKLVDYCRENFGLNVQRNTVREWAFEGGTYDYVLAYHVLEHLEKPSELFQKASEALRPGGCLFIEVPTPDLPECPFVDRLDELHGYGNLGHLHYFTPKTLPRYFEKYGFELVGTYEYNAGTMPSGGFLGEKVSVTRDARK